MKTKYTDYLLEIVNPPKPKSLTTPPLEVTNPEAMKEKPVKPAAAKPAAAKPAATKPVVAENPKAPEKVAVTLDDAQYQTIIGSLKNFWTTLANAQTKAKPVENKPVAKKTNSPSAQELADKETSGQIKNSVAPVARPKTNSDDLKNKLANEPKAQ
jgi:hypothetical protein